MKITKTQLKEIIKEELNKAITEGESQWIRDIESDAADARQRRIDRHLPRDTRSIHQKDADRAEAKRLDDIAKAWHEKEVAARKSREQAAKQARWDADDEEDRQERWEKAKARHLASKESEKEEWESKSAWDKLVSKIKQKKAEVFDNQMTPEEFEQMLKQSGLGIYAPEFKKEFERSGLEEMIREELIKAILSEDSKG